MQSVRLDLQNSADVHRMLGARGGEYTRTKRSRLGKHRHRGLTAGEWSRHVGGPVTMNTQIRFWRAQNVRLDLHNGARILKDFVHFSDGPPPDPPTIIGVSDPGKVNRSL